MSATMETQFTSGIKELAAECLNASADNISINQITGDASTRAYFRAQANTNSVIIALYNAPFDERVRAVDRLAAAEAQNPAARLTFASDPCAHIETTILFREAGLPVPRVLGSSGAGHVLFIEDVGDIRLQDWLAGRSEDELKQAYRRAVEMIVRIQETTQKATQTGCICCALAFDEAKLKYELGFFFANYINKYLGAKLDATTANAINQEFKALCSELAARPRVLTHRDYHARNLMMHNNELFIIDQQDARMGPASYDVASLLRDPYAALDNTVAEEMTELFIELKAASTVPLESLDEFRHELHLMTVQRMLKAIGTYAYQAAVVKNQIYVSYIEPAAKSALASIEALGRFDAIRGLLEKSVS